VDSIRRQVAESFPGKEILIGEFGWPSAGRMREGALPSLSNQAKVIQEVLVIASREHYRVNVIEAFDQPWKRRLEGTVGGYWGLLTADTRQPKFAFGEPVSDHPAWHWQTAGGVLAAILVFAVAIAAGGLGLPTATWAAVGITAVTAGILGPWAIEVAQLHSLGLGGWVRWIALAAVALATPLLGAGMLARGLPLPAFIRVVGRAKERTPDALALAFGMAVVATTLLAVQAALGLTFDPRYQDFPFAPLTAAVMPIALTGLFGGRGAREGARGPAEVAAAAVLAVSSVYIAINEGFANWQSLWLCAACLVLAFTLVRVRDAQN
jgi:glucan 1,3-beta-glucosidase